VIKECSYVAVKIVIVIAFSAGVAPHAVRAQQRNSKQREKSPIANVSPLPSEGSGLVNRLSPSESNERSTPESHVASSTSANEAKLTNWIQVGISGALLLVITVQAYIYHRQRQVMERQLKAMRDSLDETRKIVQQNERAVAAAEKQAHASEDAAQAAKDSASMAREAFETIERPHIIINQMESQGFAPGVEPAAVVIEFFNAGRTAASHFMSFVKLVAGPEPPADSQLENSRMLQKALIGVIPSHGSKRVVHLQADFRLSEEQQIALRNRELNLFAVGQARYSDIRGKIHVLDFRGVYNWHLGQFDLDYPDPIAGV
jgi:hypothetical protein